MDVGRARRHQKKERAMKFLFMFSSSLFFIFLKMSGNSITKMLILFFSSALNSNGNFWERIFPLDRHFRHFRTGKVICKIFYKYSFRDRSFAFPAKHIKPQQLLFHHSQHVLMKHNKNEVHPLNGVKILKQTVMIIIFSHDDSSCMNKCFTYIFKLK